jgi:hypothetical protein
MHRASLPTDATEDEIEAARVAAIVNPDAFQDVIVEHEAEVAAKAKVPTAPIKTIKDEK